MIIIIEIQNLSIFTKKNDKSLIQNLNLVIHEGDRIAIIGEEGNGKSTLMKAIMDKSLIKSYCNVEGNVKVTGHIGYLEQSLDIRWNELLISDFFLKDSPDDEIDYERYNELVTSFNALSRVKLSTDLLTSDQLIGTLSGGEKVKLQLAKILCKNPDVLLLDEPTNDLDLDSLMWLESFINNINVPILFISHDETLLERTANGILHIEQIKKKQESRHTFDRIGYREYVDKRLSLLEKQEQISKKQRSDYNKQMEKFRQIYQKVEYQQDTITRADPHGAKLLKKKIKSLKSQEKRYEKEKDDFEEIPDVEEAINIIFPEGIDIPNGKRILDLNLNELIIDKRVLSKNIHLLVTGKEHVVIIGKNGVGKTTLFKSIYNSMKDRKDITLGYMPQNYESFMDLNSKVVDFLSPSSSKEDITLSRTLLGSMKFTQEESTGYIRDLSGGQKAKLLLLSLILNKCNVLLLDEPTRNLSPLSNPVIRKVLGEFKGSIISISHDRKFINEVCDTYYELTPNGLQKKDSIEDNNNYGIAIKE